MRIENSFIPVRGVGERTERALWRAGVTRWEDFESDSDVVGPTLAERIHRFVERATERLACRDARFFAEAFPSGSHWRLYEDFRDDVCFIDIETTGLSRRRDDVTVVSVHRAGETTTLVRGRDLRRETLLRALAPAKLIVTFNGKSFDVPFLASAYDLEANLDLPHVDLRYPCQELGLTGGLDPIERAVGISRDRRDLTGRDAVRLWHAHRRGDEAALETLVEYNRADTRNLSTLAEHVISELHESVFVAGREPA